MKNYENQMKSFQALIRNRQLGKQLPILPFEVYREDQQFRRQVVVRTDITTFT